MPRIYRRYCNNCGKYYESSAKFYCSMKCYDRIGKSNPFFGREHTQESINKIREFNLIENDGWFKSGERNPMFGKKLMVEHKKKISESLKGRIFSEEHKRKIGDANRGEKCRFWNGGKSFEIYSQEFNKKLKEKIKIRDNYVCQKCFKCYDMPNLYPKTDNKNDWNKLSIHHIDYDKKNCKEWNLICLCRKCNLIVNSNRDYWQKYFELNIRKFAWYQSIYWYANDLSLPISSLYLTSMS